MRKNVKVKFFTASNHGDLESQTNFFISDKILVDIKFHEQYDFQTNTGFSSVVVLYKDKKPSTKRDLDDNIDLF